MVPAQTRAKRSAKLRLRGGETPVFITHVTSARLPRRGEGSRRRALVRQCDPMRPAFLGASTSHTPNENTKDTNELFKEYHFKTRTT